MGLVYSFGSDIAEPLRLTPQTFGSPEGEDHVRFRRITFIVGFELSFAGGAGSAE
jgi:hypothetical protein